MAKLIMCRGLPGSGKTTWASGQVLADMKSTIRVNKDDIRAELKKPWSHDLEKEVLRIRDFRISQGLSAGKTVISDDTNFGPKHEPRLRGLATKYKAEFIVNDSFLGVSLEECIKRDAGREEYERVGERVIRDMYDKYLSPTKPNAPVIMEGSPGGVQPIVLYVENPTLPYAILCDLDGTAALFGNRRSPYDASKCDEIDLPNIPVRACLEAMDQLPYYIIYMSGREDKYMEPSLKFLKKHGFPEGELYMRKTGDNRKDSIIKEELLREHIFGKFNVLFCLDDRNQVVDHYRSLGLTVFQVAPGAF